MDLGIAGKRALVCGGSKGLGRACALALAQEGVEVVIAARDAETLRASAAAIEAATGCRPGQVVADLATAAGREAAVAAAERPDIVVTNAGGPPGGDFRSLTAAHWERALALNFLAAAELIRLTVDPMIAAGFGRIVNITSLTVRMPVQNLDLSNAPRLALTGFVAGVSRQIAPTGVTINNLLPGTILTERLQDLGATAQALIDRVPMGRAGTPAEFAAACAFLCSRQAAYITGQNLLVDGGLCPITT